MTDRYGQDIIDIVGIKELEKKLTAAEKRIELLAKRGIGFEDENGGVDSKSGAPGTTQTRVINNTAANSGDRKAASDRTLEGVKGQDGEDGSVTKSGGAGTGGSTYITPGGPTIDAGKVAADEQNSKSALELIDSNFEAGDKVTQITGLYDPISGKYISSLRLDQSYIPPIDSTFTTWERADTAPPDPTWLAGYYWSGGAPAGSFAPGALECMWHNISYLNTIETNPNVGFQVLNSWTETSPGVIEWDVIYDHVVLGPGQISSPPYTLSRSACTGLTSLVCPAADPGVPYWPNTETFQLSTGQGKGLFSASEFDGTAPEKFRLGVSTLELTFGSNRNVKFEANNVGGINIYEVDANNNPTGNVGVYNGDGTLHDVSGSRRGLLRYRVN